ncbi:MAG: glycosyltransferase [Anaerolineales bacterium]|nr:glycosyltransferase [Anaerolineales bacterium]
MRLALVCQSYPPMISGAALVARRLAEGLAARGHHVLVLAAGERGGRLSGPGYTTVSPASSPTGARLKVVRLPSWPNPFRVGQRAVLFPGPAMQVELRNFHPDLVHTHDPTSLGLAAILTAHNLRRPIVLTLHQLPWFVAASLPSGLSNLARPFESLLWDYYRWLARQVQRVITPSRTIAELVAARGAGRPVAISNGVELERFTPTPATPDESEQLRQRYGLHPALPVILHVGRLDMDKRADLALQAAALAVKAIPAQIVIAGDGTQRAALEQRAADWGVAPVTRFTGYLSNDLPGLYRLASVFITASEVEIQSSVALEAAASGVPVVAVQAGSMAEYVIDGRTGYLAPPRDVRALAERLIYLLQQPEHARKLGAAGRALAEQHAPALTLDAHEQLYRELLEARLV